ncbi:MAG: glycosyltransferase family 2 protein [Thermoplasmatales archaeon]|nr:glycosyltransferase family 2 protein [Thermoplasmatales archaeon]MCW6170302.1 glycosyltransferase family 2 protein [Thermoplasmatales archaeon]
MPDKPLITVLITCYNRKEFLIDAVSSALNQTLPKQYYEILVVKNFHDKGIDKFLDKHNIKYFTKDGSEHFFLEFGLRNASGQILSFLDDDLFEPDKLKIVNETFKNTEISYYHNNFEPFMAGRVFKEKTVTPPNQTTLLIKNSDKLKKIYWLEHMLAYENNSSISVRKNIIEPWLNQSEKQIELPETNIDRFLYLCALLSDKSMYIDNRKLTYYRLHENQTSALIRNNFDSLLQKKLEFIEKSLVAHNRMAKMSNGSLFANYLKTRLTNLKIAYNFWSLTKKYSIGLEDYKLYLKEHDIYEIPRIAVLSSPTFLRRAIIKLIYHV